MAQGSYKVWPADRAQDPINGPGSKNPAAAPDPTDEAAVEIYFGLPPSLPPPPKDQIDVHASIEKLIRTLHRLYLSAKTPPPSAKEKFRHYYVRLFRLAQLGLEGDTASTDIAKTGIAVLTADLIDDEAARVKNGHLGKLGANAVAFALPFLVLYVVLQLGQPDWARDVFVALHINRQTFANFMLLWAGCFLGVWLSYGLRTTVFTLADLTTTDTDRLLPKTRLAFAGIITMVVGLVILLGLIDVKIGDSRLADIDANPTLAFLLGVFCGISELTLPASLGKRANEVTSKL